MKLRTTALLLSVLLAACASNPEPVAPIEETPLAPAEPEKAPPQKTPEELAKEKELEAIAKEREETKADAAAEAVRFTPELKKAAEALAKANYASTKAGLATILKSAHRKPGNPERDAARHPVETLDFFGVKPNQTVLEYGPGEGWYTELLAPLLASKGQLIVTAIDPSAPKDTWASVYGEKLQAFLGKSPELYGKVKTAVIDPAAPQLGITGTVDTALVIRGVHGMVNNDSLGTWLDQIHTSLKKNGVLGIVQHRAAADADPKASAKTGYVPEAWLIAQVEAHGFKLAGKSEINANPKDTKDHPAGVWTLPPNFALGDQDREKYAAIGESDRMTLKFVRVEPAAKK